MKYFNFSLGARWLLSHTHWTQCAKCVSFIVLMACGVVFGSCSRYGPTSTLHLHAVRVLQSNTFFDHSIEAFSSSRRFYFFCSRSLDSLVESLKLRARYAQLEDKTYRDSSFFSGSLLHFIGCDSFRWRAKKKENRNPWRQLKWKNVKERKSGDSKSLHQQLRCVNKKCSRYLFAHSMPKYIKLIPRRWRTQTKKKKYFVDDECALEH